MAENGADLLARIKPTRARKSVRICLRPDLLDAWQEANEELVRLQMLSPGEDKDAAKPPETLATKAKAKREVRDALTEAAQRLSDLEDQISDAEVEFVFEAMSKDAYMALLDEHPPRESMKLDWVRGYNPVAVEAASVRTCLVDPVFVDCESPECTHDECGTWQHFEKLCNPSEWDELRRTCVEVNGSVATPPKSEVAAAILRRAAAAQK